MSRFVKAPTYPISEDSALAQVQTFTEFYGIDPAAKGDKEASEAVETLLEQLFTSVRKGQVTINPDATVTQHLTVAPGDIKDIRYRIIRGEDVIAASKGVKEGENLTRLYNLLALLGDVGDGVKKLTGPDDVVARSLGALFFSR